VTVRRRLRVGVSSTGDELFDAAGAAAIHDADRPMLLSLCRSPAIEAIDLGRCRDDPAVLARSLGEAAERCDLILTTGAGSVGGRDRLADALTAAGGEVVCCRVAVKPGRPVAFGRLGRCPITALPGNPPAAFVGFHLYVTRQIAGRLGLARRAPSASTAIADFGWSRQTGRVEYLPARIVGWDAAGLPIVDRIGRGGSADLLPFILADGMAVIAADAASGAPGSRSAWIPLAAGDTTWIRT
jgi:molybdopterin molybdotransferase